MAATLLYIPLNMVLHTVNRSVQNIVLTVGDLQLDVVFQALMV